MLIPSTTRSWPRRWFPWLLGLGFAAFASHFAKATTLSSSFLSVPDCTATGGGWGCYLPAVLRVLWVIAIILAVILVLAVALLIRNYLKMKDVPILEEEDDENLDS